MFNALPNLHSTIPQSLQYLHKLKWLELRDVPNLSGSHPHLGSPKLYHLEIYNTSLSGNVPFSWGNSSTSLFRIEIEYNPHLTGSFPPIQAEELCYLYLHNNGFQGSISSILPLSAYPELRIAKFNANQFHDEDIGPLLKKIFQGSPELLILAIQDNSYIGGGFPLFEEPVYLRGLSRFTAHGLDLRGTLPDNLHIVGANQSYSMVLTLFDNRLSGEIPKNFISAEPNSTVLILQGNLFTVKSTPQWLEHAEFIQVENLYLNELDYFNSWCFVGLSFLSLLFVIVKTVYTFPYLRYSQIVFVESIKVIDGHLTDHKLLAVICVLLLFYPCFATYFAETPVLCHFSLFFFEPSNIGWKAVLALFLIIYNIIIIDITMRICILGNMLQVEQNVFRKFTVNLLSDRGAGKDLDEMTGGSTSRSADVGDESRVIIIVKCIGYGFLFLINMFSLLCYILSQSLPDENILNVGPIILFISEHCISLVIALNSALVIPRFAHYVLLAFRCSSATNVNAFILVIRSITTIVIPIAMSFLLYNDCGRGWVNLWIPCNDPNTFQIFDELSNPPNPVLDHDDVCSPFSDMDWNECIRSFLFEWCNVLMMKMVIMMFMPILIIVKETLCRKYHGKESCIVIDSEYTMLTTKLEIIFVFGIFCPLLYPLIIASMNSFIFFYIFAAKHLGWNISFKNFDRGLQSFPFHFLIFGILCQQLLSILFMIFRRNQFRAWGWFDDALSWILMICYILMDILAVYWYRRKIVSKAKVTFLERL